MNKQQLILVTSGLCLFVILYFFGNTVVPHSANAVASASEQPPMAAAAVTTKDVIAKYESGLSPQQLQTIVQLQNSVVRGDVKTQQIRVYHQLASYWGDSLNKEDLAAYYAGEAAKLENSEKNLTFAAQLLVEDMLSTNDVSMQHWLAENAKELFEQALRINPANDSSKVGLGACYMFGNISDNPMQGILAVKEIADKHPDNMYAQMMLGLGGIQSGQYDKAIERFLTVIKNQPDNLEAILNLAETYERLGDKANAIKWYTKALTFLNASDARKELENKIKSLE